MAFFAMGSQEEFWAFSKDEKQCVWEIVVEETNRRVPVGPLSHDQRERLRDVLHGMKLI
jgi:dihydrodipicolinate synthase/N-acetylneuraminate lyase